MKAKIILPTLIIAAASTVFGAYAQDPQPQQLSSTTAPCYTEQTCAPADYCLPENCNYNDYCAQYPQAALDCYQGLANKYATFGENGRRAELAKGNPEVQHLYSLHNYFRANDPGLNTQQTQQLQAIQGCMGE